MSARKQSARQAPRKVTTKTRTTNKTRSATLIGSLISVNVGPRTGGGGRTSQKRRGGGLFSRLKAAGMRHVAALKGSDYTAATRAHGGAGGGGFEGFRAARPDLVGAGVDPEEADGWSTGADGAGRVWDDGDDADDDGLGPWWRRGGGR